MTDNVHAKPLVKKKGGQLCHWWQFTGSGWTKCGIRRRSIRLNNNWLCFTEKSNRNFPEVRGPAKYGRVDWKSRNQGIRWKTPLSDKDSFRLTLATRLQLRWSLPLTQEGLGEPQGSQLLFAREAGRRRRESNHRKLLEKPCWAIGTWNWLEANKSDA